MNTEHIFLFIVFLLYMIANVISDLNHKKTSNMNHLIIFVIVFGWGIYNGLIVSMIFVGIVSFILFVIIRQIPKMNFGSGDIKMLSISFIFWDVVIEGERTFLLLIFFSFIYILTSFVYESVYRLVSFNWRGEVELAEAVPIFLASIILLTLLLIGGN